MNLFALDWVLWVAGSIFSVILLVTLLSRHRWKEFPCFTLFAGQSAISTAAMYAIYHFGSPSWYARAYYSFGFLDEAFQLAVVWEIVRVVLRPTGTWVRDAKRYFFLGGGIGVLLAAALSWMVSPPTSNLFEMVGVRIGVFNGTLVCELFLVVVFTSNRLGLGWRNHIMSLILGWSAWAAVAVTVEGLHSYFGAQNHYRDLEHARMVVFEISQAYWIVQFWLEEPARRPIPPELASYIANLHSRVKNSLDTVGAQR